MPVKKRYRTNVLVVMVCLACSLFLQTAHSQLSPTELIKGYVSKNQQRLHITPSDAQDLVITKDYVDKSTGIRHTYATQKLNGLVITNAAFSLHTKKGVQMEANDLVSLSRYTASNVRATVRAEEAITKVFDAIKASEKRTLQLKSAPTGTDSYTVFKRTEDKVMDVPCRLVYYNALNVKQLIPAWEIQMMSADRQHYWLAYVDSKAGKLLEVRDLILHCNFDENMSDDEEAIERATRMAEIAKLKQSPAATKKVSSIPLNQYRVFDLPYESPIDPGAAHTWGTKSGDALASPDGWHQVGDTANYSYTRGNNVFSFWNDTSKPTIIPVDEDHVAFANRPPGETTPLTEPYEFDYAMTPDSEPATYRKASIVNLFYWNNLMHDVFYQFGFDEASGNFQASHQFSTRTAAGGLANDPVLAQAQSSNGINNANMRTPVDGTSGQMEFFLWTYQNQLDNLVHITSSSSGLPASGFKYIAMQLSINNEPNGLIDLYTNPVVDKTLVLVERNADATVGTPSQGCSSGNPEMTLPPANDVSGKIVVIDRGSCTFAEKILGAQKGGALGVILVNNVSGDPVNGTVTDEQRQQITIPVVMIRKDAGDMLKAQLTSGAVIVGSLRRQNPAPALNRDAALDNGIIAHEYGHGVSIRLTGGPGNSFSLAGAEQGGEGWSDFMALYMTLRQDDLLQRKPIHPKGILPSKGIGNYSTFRSNDGLGIRKYPYSIDKKVNPATFGYIGLAGYNGPHAVGFVWGTMLYEMMQNFIDQYGMSDDIYEGANPTAELNPPANAKGNNIAMRLIIEGMKLQPVFPKFTDQRDAILKADTLLYGGQHSCLIWKAFARRGLGFGAISGSNSLGDEVESFDDPCDPKFTQISIVKTAPYKVNGARTNISYNITVSNLLPNAISEVLVVDTVPYPTKLVSASDGAIFKNRVLKWRIPLAANETKTLSVVLRVLSTTASKSSFAEDHEQVANSFVAENLGGIDTWSLENNAAQALSGSNYWFIANTDGESHAALRTTDPITVPDGGELVFFHKFATETSYDGGLVEISIDGTTWNYLPPNKFVKGGYTGLILAVDNPSIGGNLSTFTGESLKYHMSVATLNDYVGQDIYIRFRFATDVAVAYPQGGWWIDDVYILTDRTDYTNVVTGFTKPELEVSPGQGINAWSSATTLIVETPVTTAKPGELTQLLPKAQNNTVELKWKAAGEDHVLLYEIERKDAGTNKFSKIGEVEPSALYAEVTGYNFTDANVTDGKKYEYRIKQVKHNTQNKLSNITLVETGVKNLAVNIFPNPSDEVANINIQNPGGQVIMIHVFDAAGKRLATFRSEKTIKKVLALPVKGLKAGTYWVEVVSGKEHKTVQMIKQ